MELQEFNLRSLTFSVSMSWSWVTFQHWTNMSKLSDTDWILEVPFWGRAISFISLLLVKNSRYTDLKAVNYTQFLGFGKDITLFVNSKYYSNCCFKHFWRAYWHNYELHHKYHGKFSIKALKNISLCFSWYVKSFVSLLNLLFSTVVKLYS